MQEPQHGHPAIAGISLLAAGLGALAQWLHGWGIPDPGRLYAAFSPDDLTAWSKAIAGAIFTAINTAVGAWNLIALARGHRRRKATRRDSPAAAGPAVDGAISRRAGGA